MTNSSTVFRVWLYIGINWGGGGGGSFKNTSAWDSLGLVKSEFLWKGKDIPR